MKVIWNVKWMASVIVLWFINDAFGKGYSSFNLQTTGQIKKEKNNWGNQNVQMSFQPCAVLDCFVF